MKYLDLTFTDPASNLACDEALLELSEAGDNGEVLRVWEPANYFVVVGYSNKVSAEVDVAACRAQGIPILRRFSGGGAVVQGPGCVNYALVLDNERPGMMPDVAESYRLVLKRHQRLLRELLATAVQIEGVSDLAISALKISGNALHRKRRFSLFHGTFLVNFDFSLIASCLPMPSRQPEYRQSRSHQSFLTNLHVDAARIRRALRDEWRARDVFERIPQQRIRELVASRYAHDEWNFKF
jgi:lipoate-protein ligase A